MSKTGMKVSYLCPAVISLVAVKTYTALNVTYCVYALNRRRIQWLENPRTTILY